MTEQAEKNLPNTIMSEIQLIRDLILTQDLNPHQRNLISCAI